MKKLLGFTLAEVLITLGIIGVVAAMTIPSLIISYQKQETATELKKIYTTLNQAVRLSESENGPSSGWILPATEGNYTQSNAYWDTYIIPYLAVIKKSTANNCFSQNATWLDGKNFTEFTSTNTRSVILKDGASIYFGDIGIGITSYDYGQIWVDLNGVKKPNVVGKDIFKLKFTHKTGRMNLYEINMSRNILLSDGDYHCNKNSGQYKGHWCGGLIQLDSWQIKDDYPW